MITFILTFLFGAMCGALVLAMTLILVSGTSDKGPTGPVNMKNESPEREVAIVKE